MKFKELKGKSPEDLEKMLNELQQELMQDYVQIAAGTTPKSPGKVRQLKKTIARIKTALQVTK